MIGRSPIEIASAMRSYEGRVAEHVEKLANPAKYAERWNRMDVRERAGLPRKWREDLQRNPELADVMRGLYEDLTHGYGLMR
jgi:hypothetical protein